MPSFYRKSTGSTARTMTPRRFIVHKPISAIKKRTVRHKTAPADEMSVRQPAGAPIQKAALETLPQDPNTLKNTYVNERANSTLKSLDDLLKASPSSKNKDEVVSSDNAVYSEDDDVAAFNGVSDVSEQQELDSEIIDFERRKAEVMEEQLRLAEKEHDDEKKALERQIRELKNELHRTSPIQDNKFFTLSKQLRDAITDIERIASEEGISFDQPVTAVPPLSRTDTPGPVFSPAVPKTDTVVPKQVTQPVAVLKTVTAPVQTDASPASEPPAAEKKTLTKKKMLITGASAVALLLFVSGGISHVASKPKVDQKIVNQYLNTQQGKVQGIQTVNSGNPNQNTSGANDPSQADVTFEQSEWADFNDSGFGIMLQFPKNAVKPVKTDSNVTFIRKTGYLFKVQRIETALTLDEYWKQIKATSLNYDVAQIKFKGKPALKLELTDMADYPGDRYLVKEGNFIYDVWYATASNNFPKDDILRAQKMLDSLSIVGGKE